MMRRVFMAATKGWPRTLQCACSSMSLLGEDLPAERVRCFSTTVSSNNHAADDAVSSLQKSPRPKPRTDPTAKRPTQKCDPYGQGGKAMSMVEAKLLKSTIHEDWKFEHVDDAVYDSESTDTNHQPIAMYREFLHPDYLQGARFVHKIAAIAEMNAHFPRVTLDRRIVRKTWQVVSRIRCHTTVLEGLSANDFHLAMLIDVEISRPEMHTLLLREAPCEE